MILYKFTREDGSATHGRGVWTVGKWRTATAPLIPCQRGIHYCKGTNLVPWINAALWVFEDGGEAVDAGDKMVTTRGRIVERVETWNETTARLFAADCGESVLHLFEKVYPDDDRPRKAIEVARQRARGEAGAAAWAAAGAAARDAAGAAAWAAVRAAAWAAAGDAARDAAGDAAWAAAWDAAWDAASAASRAAARDAAWAAARDAAWDAAWAASWDAAWAAARDAAGDAARDAAWDAARDAAWDGQNTRLMEYVTGAVS